MARKMFTDENYKADLLKLCLKLNLAVKSYFYPTVPPPKKKK